MNFIHKLLGNGFVVLPLFAIAVFFAVYYWADRVFLWIYQKSLGKRSEVLKHMKLLGMDTNEKKVIRLLLASSFGVGFLFFLVALPNFTLGVFLGISTGIAGFQLFPLILKSRYEKYCNRFVEQMVDALTIMANGIKAGSVPLITMQRVVEIMSGPVKNEFSQVITQTQFGQSFEDSLTELGERIPRPDVQMFVTAINILKETGGNLSETFETIVFTIRERQKLEKKISAMTAQGIMQGIIITCVPFAIALVLFAVAPDFIEPMFKTTIGLVLLGTILVLQIIGGIMIKKIVTIKV